MSNRRHLAPALLPLALLAALLAPAGAAAAGGSDSIVLRPSVRLDADCLVVRLSDVADLAGPLAQALADSVVYEAPAAPLRPVSLHVDALRRRLDGDGVNLGLVSLSGRECVMRWRAAATPAPPAAEKMAPVENGSPAEFADRWIGQATLRGVVADYLARHLLGAEPADVQLRFRAEDAAALDRPRAGFDFEIRPMASALSPVIPLEVNVYERGALAARERLSVEVALRRPVVVAQRYVARGAVIGVEDVVEEIRLVEPGLRTAPSRAAEVVGREARGRLVPGEALRDGDALAPVAITRNSEVWVRARHGLFVLRLRARALDEGRTGDVIRVRRLSDRAEFTGVVTVEGEVAIEVGG